jgi:polyhydroxybutyrate depolymerase
VSGTSTSTEPTNDERPFDVFVPTSYDGSNAVPLVLLLHGYTVSSDLQEAYFNIQTVAEERGFLYVHPQGTTDARGSSFWNATDGCCNFFGSSVDDSAYLASLIAQVQSRYQVDPRRIYMIGHSNGGFMSYRMACDHADTIAAIVSLAGATFDDASDCAPTQAVSVLQIHGTADGVIRYDGGSFAGVYPSAPTSVQTWAAYDGCGATAVHADTRRDLERDIEGDDTTVSQFPDCPSGIDVELWTIDGGAHIPALSSTFIRQAIDFLYAHPKP